MRRELNWDVPSELQQAEELLEKYGRWAQERHRAQRCGSAEGKYRSPVLAGSDEAPVILVVSDWSARQVQLALQVVPMQYRRVLFAIYVPQKEHPMAARRRYRISRDVWERSRIEGLRQFWNIYRLRYLAKNVIIA